MRWGAVIVVALMVAVLSLAARTAVASASTRTYVAEYNGSLSYNSDSEDPSMASFNRTLASLTFDATVFTEVSSGGGQPTSHGTLVMQGSYSNMFTNGMNVESYRCTYRQVPHPRVNAGLTVGPGGANATLASLLDLAGSGNLPQGGCARPAPVTFGLEACGTAGCNGVCEENYAPGKQELFNDFQVADGPTINTYPRHGSKSYHYDVTLDPSGRCYSGTQKVTVSIRSVFTLGGGPPSASPPKRREPRLTPEQRDAKISALEQLRDTWAKALTACAGTGAFTTLLAAGPAGVAVGIALIPGTAYQCKAYTQIIKDAADTFSDPPLASDNQIARARSVTPSLPRLPGCVRAAAAERSLCNHARADVLSLLGADRTAAGVTHAVEVTISRESYARMHDQSGAARRQDRALGRLVGQLRQARDDESAAGRRLARVLSGAHLQVRSGKALSAAQITILLRRIADSRVTRGDIAMIDRTLLRPAPRDWLRTLGAS